MTTTTNESFFSDPMPTGFDAAAMLDVELIGRLTPAGRAWVERRCTTAGVVVTPAEIAHRLRGVIENYERNARVELLTRRSCRARRR